MSRTLTSGMTAVTTANVVRPAYFVRMTFDANISAGNFIIGKFYKIVSIGSTDFTAIGASANTVGLEFTATGVGSGDGVASESPNELNVWNGIGDLSFGGNTYTGTGDLLSISQITETSDISATGINVLLSGVKTSLIAIAKNHEYQGRPLTVSLGAFDASGDLIADPVIVFSGFMDTMTISESGAYSTISISVENKLVSFERSKVRRYTAEDQKIDYPADKGFEFVTAIVQKQIIWGRPSSTGNNTGSDSYTCFASGSKVLMADFKTKKIESVLLDDLVLGRDGKINKVIKLYHHPIQEQTLFKINNDLELTDSHPMLTTQGWKSFSPEKTKSIHPDLDIAGKLELGDLLIMYSENKKEYELELTTIQKRKCICPVFNLDVDGDDTFVVNNFVGHNK